MRRRVEAGTWSWWRANRWWLLVLPVALVLAGAAASYRVRTSWWDSGYHHETASVRGGAWGSVREGFTDPLGRTERTYRVRLDGLSTTSTVPASLDDLSLPAGVVGYRVHLAFTARVDQDMNYCAVMLVGDDGTVYGGGSVSNLISQSNLCVPDDHPGPKTPLTPTDRRGVVAPGEERPRSWTVDPIVLAPASARIRAVRLSFQKPEYLTLALPPTE